MPHAQRRKRRCQKSHRSCGSMTKPRKQRAFYTSVFNNSMVLKPRVMAKPVRAVSGRPKGSVMTVAFQLDGQEFVALNGGPQLTSPKPFPLSSTARLRRKWIGIGSGFRRAGKKFNAAGSKTNTVSPGRSCRRYWTKCSMTPIPKKARE
jgi:hypothetical protein